MLACPAHRCGSSNDRLKDFNLVRPLILVLIRIPPQGDLQLVLGGDVLGDNPPEVPGLDDVLERRVASHQAAEVTEGRGR
eukprot:67831-Heterocapsa_arctica.AAC.1